jgi:hypothetical protein
MGNSPLILDLYGIWGSGRSLFMTGFPRVARLTFDFEGVSRELTIANPSSFLEVAEFLTGDCCQIAVFDRNVEEGNFLEYGRFRVEFHSEDDLITQFEADAVTYENRNGEPPA